MRSRRSSWHSWLPATTERIGNCKVAHGGAVIGISRVCKIPSYIRTCCQSVKPFEEQHNNTIMHGDCKFDAREPRRWSKRRFSKSSNSDACRCRYPPASLRTHDAPSTLTPWALPLPKPPKPPVRPFVDIQLARRRQRPALPPPPPQRSSIRHRRRARRGMEVGSGHLVLFNTSS